MQMRSSLAMRIAAVAAAVSVVGFTAACGSDSTTGTNTSASLSGNYKLLDFQEAGQDIMQADSIGTATLTPTTYKVTIVFYGATQLPAIIDSGTYTATGNGSGSFSETSLVTGEQSTGTYTVANGTWTVNLTSDGLPITQAWQKQ